MLRVAVLLLCAGACGEAALRMVGGRDALPGELPYVVRIEIEQGEGPHIIMRHSCTGTLISPTWVLTAAHCLPDGLKLIIRYGSVHNPAGANDTFSPVVEYIRHPRYLRIGRKLVKNDIALLRVEHVKLQQYGRLSSVPYLSLFGLEAVAAGYGLTNSSSGFQTTLDAKKPLQILQVILRKCDAEGVNVGIPEICLSPLCGEKNFLMQGDSGGPTLHSTGVVGVSSTGYPGQEQYPVSTRSHLTVKLHAVSPHLDWILSHVRR